MLRTNELLNNIREFKYSSLLPLSLSWPSKRRSAVLVLLFIGHRGELRVLLTKRSRALRAFSGHVSLPGGKADNDLETFEQVARREAEEEIGLPQGSKELHEKFGMQIENICNEIPCYLSRTFLSVKPVVYFLHNETNPMESLNASKFFGKLNPGETSSIFSVPLSDMVYHLFQNRSGSDYKPEYTNHSEISVKWGGLKWPIRHYLYPRENINDVAWLNEIADGSSGSDSSEVTASRDLWGLTAKILYDLSLIANKLIQSDNSTQLIGHEDLIYGLKEFGGQLKTSRSDWEINMIGGARGYRYDNVIPKYYMDKLQKISTKY
ncbi:hypothetical protein HG535_0F04090 [Zygotorulaspora mrakii]|uniref:Nudix hydrolase domain-containing protein n=1 Tax=Zygotorulaspora mrakii TaxID=42260 RepID=A0A7H9B5T4_ZYGMR|nr:uncharacterized protein HG535_0F04090 [Zygotorulaspora mrakii]QLG73897.1 hypothetical protein HG535_0F04090 [Zygotorulaspora mrakii]